MISHNPLGELATHCLPMGLSCAASAYKSLEKGTGQASSTRYFFIFRVQCSFGSVLGGEKFQGMSSNVCSIVFWFWPKKVMGPV